MDYNNIHVNQYEEPQNATIYIYRNGDAGSPAFKVLNLFNWLFDSIKNWLYFTISWIQDSTL